MMHHSIRNSMMASSIFVMVVLLILQFILGMYVNLFVSFSPVNSFFMMSFNIPTIIMIHMMFGFLILAFSIFIFMLSLLNGSRVLSMIALISVILVIIAGIFGIEFLFSENNLLSYGMSIAFITLLFMQFLYIYKLQSFKFYPTRM